MRARPAAVSCRPTPWSAILKDESTPLEELLSRILAPEPVSRPTRLLPLGTMQGLNRRLAGRPWLDFLNATLRGVGQVIFVNNPVSGLLILVAMFIQSPWLGLMSLVGTAAATLTAMAMRLAPPKIQNGIFGLNGLLVGAAMGFFGNFGNGAWNPVWVVAVILLSALATVVMHTLGTWFAVRLKVPPLGVATNSVLLVFLIFVVFAPRTFFDLGPPPPAFPSGAVDGLRLLESLPAGIGQVFFSDKLVPLLLIIVAIGICTPIGLAVGLLGCAMYLLAGLLLGARPDELYLGLWGYNAVLTATSIGGVFFAPNRRSISLGALCALFASMSSIVMARWLSPMRLPVLSVPFMVVTLGIFSLLRRSIPSLVPVALHAVASPEEHWRRYVAARDILTHFRRQLRAALLGEPRGLLFEAASPAIKRDLRRAFDAMDPDHSGGLSTAELAAVLEGAGTSEGELNYLFACMDRDASASIEFEEFGELMLRQRRLMSRYEEFVTYFLPIDADEDQIISIKEMNAAMRSVGEPSLTGDEIELLQRRAGGRPMTWNRFVEVLLVT